MKKYDVRFCNCGRVHFIDGEKINKAIDKEKQVLVICNNCGNSFVIGADIITDEDGLFGYSMYSFDMRDTEINDMSKINCIVFTKGEHIRMMTGGEATFYSNDTFIDWNTNKPENISNDEWERLQKTVNTQHTINWIRDDDKLKEMSRYITSINWKGTKYEQKWL